jgi:sec-independent protein translocase protein TatC
VSAAARALKPLPPEREPRRDSEMSLLEHLEALRHCLVRSAIAIAVGMVPAFVFVNRIYNFVFEPTRKALPPGSSLIFTQPAEAFALDINLALIAGAILASPIVFFNIWRFISPALYANEKRFVIPFVCLTTAGAVGGAAFSHYIVFPYMIAFFGTFSRPDLLFLPRLEDLFGLYLKMLAGMVLVFQMPTFAFFLAKMRIITAGFLWRNFRYAILIIFIAAAVLTPSSDPWNQAIFAAPMIALYVLSIGIAFVFGA